MAQIVNATNLQKLEYDVTTAEGPSHITIVTGVMLVVLAGSGGFVQQGSFETLLDPTLAPGQFRRATATVSITDWTQQTAPGPPSPGPLETQLSIDQVEATLNDESGRIQLRVDASVRVGGSGGNAQINGIAFQVTTLSKL